VGEGRESTDYKEAKAVWMWWGRLQAPSTPLLRIITKNCVSPIYPV